MGVELPKRITLLCDLRTEEGVQTFEILSDAGFFITVGHYPGTTWSCPGVYAGEFNARGLQQIRQFAEDFGPIAKEKNYPAFYKKPG